MVKRGLYTSCWVMLIISSFWLFFGRTVHSFGQEKQLEYQSGWEQKNQRVEGILRQLELDGEENIIIHLIDPACSCSRFSLNYIQSVIRDKDFSEYKQYVFTLPGKSIDELPSAIALPKAQYQLLKQFVPSTPSALIWYQAKKQVAFIGAHTSGEICGQGQSNLALVANNLEQQVNPSYFPFLQKGCFCST